MFMSFICIFRISIHTYNQMDKIIFKHNLDLKLNWFCISKAIAMNNDMKVLVVWMKYEKIGMTFG